MGGEIGLSVGKGPARPRAGRTREAPIGIEPMMEILQFSQGFCEALRLL
jgi:hypothetical protein